MGAAEKGGVGGVCEQEGVRVGGLGLDCTCTFGGAFSELVSSIDRPAIRCIISRLRSVGMALQPPHPHDLAFQLLSERRPPPYPSCGPT